MARIVIKQMNGISSPSVGPMAALAAFVVAGAFTALAGVCTVKMRPGEHWWGGVQQFRTRHAVYGKECLFGYVDMWGDTPRKHRQGDFK